MSESRQRGLKANPSNKGRRDPGRGAKIANADAQLKGAAVAGQYSSAPKPQLTRQNLRDRERHLAKSKFRV